MIFPLKLNFYIEVYILFSIPQVWGPTQSSLWAKKAHKAVSVGLYTLAGKKKGINASVLNMTIIFNCQKNANTITIQETPDIKKKLNS